MHFSLLFLQEIICQKNTVSTKKAFHTFAHNRTYYTVQRICLLTNCAGSSAPYASPLRVTKAFLLCCTPEAVINIWSHATCKWLLLSICGLLNLSSDSAHALKKRSKNRAAFKSVDGGDPAQDDSESTKPDQTAEADLLSDFQRRR